MTDMAVKNGSISMAYMARPNGSGILVTSPIVTRIGGRRKKDSPLRPFPSATQRCDTSENKEPLLYLLHPFSGEQKPCQHAMISFYFRGGVLPS